MKNTKNEIKRWDNFWEWVFCDWTHSVVYFIGCYFITYGIGTIIEKVIEKVLRKGV